MNKREKKKNPTIETAQHTETEKDRWQDMSGHWRQSEPTKGKETNIKTQRKNEEKTKKSNDGKARSSTIQK
jgi:hypothetical protein